jgi:hypothetical protein
MILLISKSYLINEGVLNKDEISQYKTGVCHEKIGFECPFDS